jgi:hypothetical protein
MWEAIPENRNNNSAHCSANDMAWNQSALTMLFGGGFVLSAIAG